jgi:uncharacterized protein YqjF (DUF2071 family)
MMIARMTSTAPDRIAVMAVLRRTDMLLTDAPVDPATVARQSSRRKPTWMVTW